MPQVGVQWSRQESDLSLVFSPYRLVQIMVLFQPCSKGPAPGKSLPSLAISLMRPLGAPNLVPMPLHHSYPLPGSLIV